MTELSFFNILDAIEFPHTRGKSSTGVIGHMAYSMMFFLRPEQNYVVEERMAAAEAHIRALIPVDHYLFWKPDGGEKSYAVQKHPPTPPGEILEKYRQKRRPGAFAYLLWNSAEDGRDAPTHHLEYFYNSDTAQPHFAEANLVGNFQLTFPLPWLEARDDPGFVQTLFVDLCRHLCPFHAASGLHLSTSLDPIWLQQGAEEFYPFLKKHPGLMHGRSLAVWMGGRFGMYTVNWLTAVHEDLLDRCGGRTVVLNQLELDGFAFWDYPDGMIVQAGPSPQMGDREAGVKIPHYGELARALKPARVEANGYKIHAAANWQVPGAFRGLGVSENDYAAAQEEYLTRLDDM